MNSKQKFLQTKRLRYALYIVFSLLFVFSLQRAFADIYAPGATLNPDCTMGSANCGIDFSLSSSSEPLFLAASSSLLSTTSASALYVPYTGANQNIDIGTNNLLGDNVLTLQSPNGFAFSGNATDSLAFDLNNSEVFSTFNNSSTNANGTIQVNPGDFEANFNDGSGNNGNLEVSNTGANIDFSDGSNGNGGFSLNSDGMDYGFGSSGGGGGFEVSPAYFSFDSGDSNSDDVAINVDSSESYSSFNNGNGASGNLFVNPGDFEANFNDGSGNSGSLNAANSEFDYHAQTSNGIVSGFGDNQSNFFIEDASGTNNFFIDPNTSKGNTILSSAGNIDFTSNVSIGSMINTSSNDSVSTSSILGILTPSGAYTAFGDSITNGSGGSQQSNAYVNLISTDLGVTNLVNYGYPGDFACNVATEQVFPNENPNNTSNPIYTLMVGTNEAINKGAGSYESVYEACDQASLAWLAVPSENKVFGTSSSVVLAGSWTNSNTYTTGRGTYPTVGIQSSTNGSVATFPITTTGGPIYIWYRIIDGNGGTFTYQLDGGSAVSENAFTNPEVDDNNNGNQGIALARITGVSAGSHTIAITVTSATNSGNLVPIIAVGTAPSSISSGSPKVFPSGLIYYQDDELSASTAAYNADALADADLLADDGLPIYPVNVRNYFTIAYDVSGIFGGPHPNDLGHSLIRDAFEAEMLQVAEDLSTSSENSLSLPSVAFQVSTTSSADGVADFISSSGQSALYIGADGNISIGTTTPTTALSVIGTTTTSGLNISNLSNTFLAVDANGNVVATTSPSGGSSQWATTSVGVGYDVPGIYYNIGNVGIGTTNPNDELVVTGTSTTDTVAYFGGNADIAGNAVIGNTNTLAQGLFLLVGHRYAPNLQQINIESSDDGINFSDFEQNPIWSNPDNDSPAIAAARDPSIVYYHNIYYMVYSAIPYNGGFDSNTVFGLATSSDLKNWNFVGDISVTSIGTVYWTWAPSLLVDASGNLHVYVSVAPDGSDSTFSIYEMHPTNPSATTWSVPALMLGTNKIDADTVYNNGTYYLWYKNETTKYIEYATSSSPTGPFTVAETGNWAGWGTGFEAPCPVQISANDWRIYLDEYQNTSFIHYSDSYDNFATWTAPLPISTPIPDLDSVSVIRLRGITPSAALSVIGTTTTSGLNISNLANGFLAVDANGNVVATTSSGSQWTTNGSNIYYTTGNVSIGTSTPGSALSVDGAIDATSIFSSSIGLLGSSMQPLTADIIVVGGGGAGSSGGGGGGGFIATSTEISDDPYVVTVGNGGSVTHGNGYDSIFGSFDAVGGGAGAGINSGSGANGGSGGGGGSTCGGGPVSAGGLGTTGQGNNGGSAAAGNCIVPYTSGGGGGAGAAGQNSTATTNGNGGIGTTSSITGTVTYYSGGGGSGDYYGTEPFGTGGLGGGGNGGNPATAGTANTGGGGGGTINGGTSGNGGSGVVIIKYLTSADGDGTGGIITHVGGYTIHTFTSSGIFTPPPPSPVIYNITLDNNLFSFENGISAPNLAVGTTSSPITQFDVYGSSTNDLANFASSSGQSILYITSTGKVGIGTTTPSATLTIVGNPASTTLRLANFGAGTLMTDSLGNVYDNSDERLKNIIGTSTIGLNELEGLTPINYYWNATSGLDMTDENTGFSAQNVEQYIPNAVATDTRGYLTLQDRPIIAALVNAVKEIGSFISTITDGIAHLTGIAIGTSDKPEGITMYSPSGNAFCIQVSDTGLIQSSSGECSNATSTISTASVVSSISQASDSSNTLATSTASTSDNVLQSSSTSDDASSSVATTSDQDTPATSTNTTLTSPIATSTSDQATTTSDTDIIATTSESATSPSDTTDAATSTGQ